MYTDTNTSTSTHATIDIITKVIKDDVQNFNSLTIHFPFKLPIVCDGMSDTQGSTQKKHGGQNNITSLSQLTHKHKSRRKSQIMFESIATKRLTHNFNQPIRLSL